MFSVLWMKTVVRILAAAAESSRFHNILPGLSKWNCFPAVTVVRIKKWNTNKQTNKLPRADTWNIKQNSWIWEVVCVISTEYIVAFDGYYSTSTRDGYVKSVLETLALEKWKIIPRNNPASDYPSDFSLVKVRIHLGMQCGVSDCELHVRPATIHRCTCTSQYFLPWYKYRILNKLSRYLRYIYICINKHGKALSSISAHPPSAF